MVINRNISTEKVLDSSIGYLCKEKIARKIEYFFFLRSKETNNKDHRETNILFFLFYNTAEKHEFVYLTRVKYLHCFMNACNFAAVNKRENSPINITNISFTKRSSYILT